MRRTTFELRRFLVKTRSGRFLLGASLRVVCLVVLIVIVLIANDVLRDSNAFTSHFKNLVRPIDDAPGDVVGDCAKPILIGHYFGDFQSEYCRFQHGSIYGITSTDRGIPPPAQYLPGFFLLSSVTFFLDDIRVSFFVTMFASALVFTAACSALLKRKEISREFLILGLSPMLVAIWRGNFSWIVSTTIMLVWIPMARAQQTRSYWLIAIGMVLKPVWTPFLLMYILTRQIKQLVKAIAVFSGINLLAVLVLDVSSRQIVALLKRLVFRSEGLDPLDPRLGIRFDVELLLIVWEKLVGFPPAFNQSQLLLVVKSGIVLLITMVPGVVCRYRRASTDPITWDMTLIMISFGTVLVSQPSYMYFLFVPVAALLTIKETPPWKAIIIFGLFPILIPVRILMTGDFDTLGRNVFESEFTIGSLTTPVVSVTVMILATKAILQRRSQLRLTTSNGFLGDLLQQKS